MLVACCIREWTLISRRSCFSPQMETRASIDLGSHTARLLVARVSEGPSGLAPVAGGRAYARLREHSDLLEGISLEEIEGERCLIAISPMG